MALTLITPPAVEPVSLAEAKLNLRIDHADEDGDIQRMIASARAFFERETGLRLIRQTWRLALDDYSQADETGRRVVLVPVHPLLSLEAFTVAAFEGTAETVALEAVVADLASRPGRLAEVSPGAWPMPSGAPGGIAVTFEAGHGDSAADVPADMKEAVLGLVAAIYERRAAGTGPDGLRATARAIVHPYRDIRL